MVVLESNCCAQQRTQMSCCDKNTHRYDICTSQLTCVNREHECHVVTDNTRRYDICTTLLTCSATQPKCRLAPACGKTKPVLFWLIKGPEQDKTKFGLKTNIKVALRLFWIIRRKTVAREQKTQTSCCDTTLTQRTQKKTRMKTCCLVYKILVHTPHTECYINLTSHVKLLLLFVTTATFVSSEKKGVHSTFVVVSLKTQEQTSSQLHEITLYWTNLLRISYSVCYDGDICYKQKVYI